MIRPVQLVTILSITLLSSCGAIIESAIDSAFESSSDRRIREDTDNLNAGRPLQHYNSEKRLRVAREDRMLNELMSD